MIFSNTRKWCCYTRHYATRILGIKLPLPDLDTQRAIVRQIEEEWRLVNANKELIALFEAKVKATIDRVWGGTPDTDNASECVTPEKIAASAAAGQ